MKKIATIILIVLLTACLFACNATVNKPNDSTNGTTNGNNQSGSADGGKSDDTANGTTEKTVLVAYFSASGNTERVARYISEATGGTLFELEPVNPYTSADLSWTTAGSRVNREHNDETLRDIELVSTAVEEWEKYDVVFIGYPIWWGIAAWPVNNFVKNNNFNGKTVIPFATSSSSGMGQSGTQLRDMAGTGNWLSGQRFSSGASKSSVESWIKGLNL